MNLQKKNKEQIDAITAAWSLIVSQDKEGLVDRMFTESRRGWAANLHPGSVTDLETSQYGGIVHGYIHCTFTGLDNNKRPVVNRQYISLFEYVISND